MLCEKGMTTIVIKTKITLLVLPQNIKHATPPKTQNNIGRTNKYCTNCEINNHNVEICIKKKE
jgi:hypothetical protein